MSGNKRVFSSFIQQDDTYERKRIEEDKNIERLKEEFKRPRLNEIRQTISQKYASVPNAVLPSNTIDNDDSLSVFNNEYNPDATDDAVSLSLSNYNGIGTDTHPPDAIQSSPDFTVSGILEQNHIYPIRNLDMRNHRALHKYPSHIVIEITGHGTVIERPGMYDNPIRNTNVNIFSLASYGNSVYSCQFIDDDNRDEIRGVIHQNYPILQSFIAFRDHLLYPHSWKTEMMRNGGIDDEDKHSVTAMKRGEYAYFHHFKEHMLYESGSYNEHTPPNFPLSVYIYDVRYPTTEAQESLLQFNLEEFMELLFIDGIITKRPADDNKMVDVLLLSTIVEYLKRILGFQYITIFESACREDDTMNFSMRQKRRNFNNQYREFNQKIRDYPEQLLHGGRRRITRKIRIKHRRTMCKKRKTGRNRRTYK